MAKRKFPPNKLIIVFDRKSGHPTDVVHPEDMGSYDLMDDEVTYEFTLKKETK